MALGFGFNKAKVLASAEKNVQQGKLQNAIADYEKIIKEDPKDLTVLNTIGDLNTRIGHNDKAVDYFKKVGDAYAAEGFTVKAIAMYKKLSKLNPSEMSNIQRLAELYTAQGLYNDARAQYVQVAEGYLKSGKNEDAAKVFQKILELDPDNTAMQTKLADLYMKLGKKADACDIYLSAAQSLYAKQSMDQADEALARVLSISSSNVDALLLRGTIAAESGDGANALRYLTQIPDHENNVNALRAMLRAYLLMSKLDEAGPLATNLIGQHKDLNAMNWYTDALMNAGRHVEALQLYATHADQFIATNKAGLQRTLTTTISKIKDSAPALESVRHLLIKLNDRSHDAELMELLAHAYVGEGKLEMARDLYQELAQAEPENPLHAQNHKQVVAMLGTDPASAPLSAELGSQAIMMDAIDPEHHAPVIQHPYPEDIAAAVRAALTDSELFESYNLPPKAIAPLEAGLEKAPRDYQINLRLAALYPKVQRFADAARAATIVREVYAEHGFTVESLKYAELATQYLQTQGGKPAQPQRAAAASVKLSAAAQDFSSGALEGKAAASGGFMASSVAHLFESEKSAGEELTADAFGDMFGVAAPPPAPVFEAASATAPTPVSESFSAAVPEMSAAPAAAPVEFDTPSFADTAIPEPATAAPAETHAEAHAEWEEMLTVEHPQAAAPPAIVEPASPDTKAVVEEINFYISQSMWTEASAATQRLVAIDPASPLLAAFQAEIAAGSSAAASAAVPAAQAPPPGVSEFTFESFSDDAPPAELEAPAAEAVPVPVAQTAPPVVEAPVPVAQTALPVIEAPVVTPPIEVVPAPIAQVAPPIIEAPVVTPPIEAVPAPIAQVASPPVPAPAQAPAPPAESEDFLGDLVSDLEDALGDFAPAPAAKAASPEKAAPPPQAISAPPPAPPPVVAAPPPVMQIEPSTLAAHEETSALTDMFAEFKDDVEETAGQAEDPDTHYNLGIAFKEMGLLDEAIGELQKVCHAIEKGHPFTQPVQAYTWLAQCLVEKDVPQAAVRWYEKALKLPLEEDSRLAVHYDLGNAQELAGNTKAAYIAFMECYSSNIDYRDVADRVKALKP